jgi:hypothetical protein
MFPGTVSNLGEVWLDKKAGLTITNAMQGSWLDCSGVLDSPAASIAISVGYQNSD